jgi:hypothetical protein
MRGGEVRSGSLFSYVDLEAASAWMAGARSAVIQSSPAGFSSSSNWHW